MTIPSSESDTHDAVQKISSTAEPQSHRVYWQQWLMTTTAPTETSSMTTSAAIAAAATYHTGPGGAVATTSSATTPVHPQVVRRQRQLITSSAAVRIFPNVAKAKDVTELLRKTLNFTKHSATADNGDDDTDDSLVLVGTIHVPDDYILFEHETIHRQHRGTSNATDDCLGMNKDAENEIHMKETLHLHPFHLVKTLRPMDDPLSVREEMMQRLKERLAVVQDLNPEIIDAPKVQWFFVPGSTLGGPSVIPNCIELEGYATTMDDDDDDDSNQEDEYDYDIKAVEEKESLGAQQTTDNHTDEDVERSLNSELVFNLLDDMFPQGFIYRHIAQSSLPLNDSSVTNIRITDPKEAQKWRRYLQISQSHNSNPQCLAGHLLKRSSMDPHVWKKIYCVLTDDDMWYVHALQHPDYLPLNSRAENHKETLCEEKVLMAPRHGRISLNRALLIEPSVDNERSPLHRTPHAFQVVDGNGIAHHFRSASEHTFQRWTHFLAVRLLDKHENSFLANAQLIIGEESMARTDRWKKTAVGSLAPGTIVSQLLDSFDGERKYNDIEDDQQSSSNRILSLVLQFGLNIAQYREGCRHIQALLMSNGGSVRNLSNVGGELASLHAQQMVEKLWEEASVLLQQATQVASQACISDPHCAPNGNAPKKQPSRSLQTLCNHVEFQITGQFGQSKSSPVSHSVSTHHAEPPPIELFDNLLKEVHLLVQMR